MTLPAGRLEELHRIPGRVVHQDLLATNACDDVVAEMRPDTAQLLYNTRQIGNFDHEAVPAARRRHRAVRHCLSTTRAAAGSAEHKSKVASRQHGEGRRRMHFLVEAKVRAVESDRRVDVIDDVADTDGCHWTDLIPLCRLRALGRRSPGPCRCRGGRLPAQPVADVVLRAYVHLGWMTHGLHRCGADQNQD